MKQFLFLSVRFSKNNIQVIAVVILAFVMGIAVPLYSRYFQNDTQASVLQNGSSSANPTDTSALPQIPGIPPLSNPVSDPNTPPSQLFGCSANPQTVNPGQGVTWSVQTDAQNGNPLIYIWTGAVTGMGKTLNSTYNVPGTYIATVKSSDGQSGQQATCMVSVLAKSSSASVVAATIAPDSTNESQKQMTVPSLTQENLTTSTQQFLNNSSEQITGAPPVLPLVQNQQPTEQTTATQPQTLSAPVPMASKCPGSNYPTDIANHWAENFIKQAYDNCLFRGYHDGTFHPDAPITRAEAVKAALIAAGIPPKLGCYTTDCGTPFTDLAIWESQWLRAAYDLKIVKGRTENTFDPESSITRGEAVVLIAKAFKIPPHTNCFTANCGAGHPYNFFLDVTDIVQGSYLRALWDLHLIEGTGQNIFEPARPITRAEMAVLLIKTSTQFNMSN